MSRFRYWIIAPTALSVALSLPSYSNAQHEWQTPPSRDVADVERILNATNDAATEPSRDLNIVWVWGVDKNHERGAHEYGWVMDRYVNNLLPQVPGLNAERAMYFPSPEQWQKADLVVFYLQSPRPWSDDQYAMVDRFQRRGGGLAFFHLALLEGAGSHLAERIGFAYGTQDVGKGTTQWGVLPTPVQRTKGGADSAILAGFDDDIHLVDEHYWNLLGDVDDVTTLLTAPGGPTFASTAAPKPEVLDGKAWPVAWTKEIGRARVFATVLGHNYFTFNDPYFRIIALRAFAWTMNESFEPFEAVVLQDLQR